MDWTIVILLTIGGLSFIALVLLLLSKLIIRRLRRKAQDRPILESHKLDDRPPTWRFQKYHPTKCPHYNGIYREVLVGDQKKTIFVCADCVDAVEPEEIKHRDKFKNQI